VFAGGPVLNGSAYDVELSPEEQKDLYCNADSSGDWQLTSCDSPGAVQVECDDLSEYISESAPEVEVAEEPKCIDRRFGNPTWKLFLTPDGYLCTSRKPNHFIPIC
jgi:hypothetical protein